MKERHGPAMRALALLASLIGLTCAGVLTHSHLGTASDSGLCEALSETGCSIALESSFGVVLGVPLSVLAMGAYAALALAAARGFTGDGQRSWASVAALLSTVMVASGLFLLGVMAQARAYCPMCLIMDGCDLVLAGVWVPRALRLSGPAWARPPAVGAAAAALLVTAAGEALYLTLASPAAAADPPAPSEAGAALTVAQCDAVELSVLEISDFLCPYCKRLEANLSGLLSSCGARVDKRFVHFPLDSACNRFVSKAVHPGACRLAEASECARLQGAFPRFAAGLFASAPRDDASLKALARRLELDMGAFTRCLEDGTARDRVRTDIELAHRLGVRSTPTFYLNGRRLEGALSRARLEQEIRAALAKDEREIRAIQSQAPDDPSFSAEPVEACDGERFSQEQHGCAAP